MSPSVFPAIPNPAQYPAARPVIIISLWNSILFFGCLIKGLRAEVAEHPHRSKVNQNAPTSHMI